MKKISLLLGTALVTLSASANRPKNIIYILADDLGYGDLSCLGQDKFETPNIDRLASEGLLFTQHYAGSTVSAPSRSTLLTGQHTGHTYIRGNRELPNNQEGQQPIADQVNLISEMLKDGGYTTGCFGKWGLGYPGSEGDPTKQGFDEFYGYNCQREAHRYYPTHLWHNEKRVILDGNKNQAMGDYAPDLIQHRALQFIESNSKKPFFLYLAYLLPHAEIIAPQDSILARFTSKFEEIPFKAPTGGDYDENFMVEKYSSQDKPYAHFAAMVTRLDMYVGQVVAQLELLGIADETVIFFTSDNGPHQAGGANPDFFNSSGPFRGYKRDLYEGGIRVPLVAWSPGYFRAGVSSEHICAMWDMMSTFSEIANLKVQPKGDGISILPTLTGNGKQKEHQYLYWEFHQQKGKIALRMGNWKGVIRNVTTDENSRLELYDLSNDIHEDRDIASNHPDITKIIRLKMREAHTTSPIFKFKILDFRYLLREDFGTQHQYRDN